MSIFDIFKTKCPICKMEIGETYVEGHNRKFCSEECRESYRQKMIGEEKHNSHGGGCCH